MLTYAQKNNANPNLKNQFGETALDYAIEQKHFKIVEILKKYSL